MVNQNGAHNRPWPILVKLSDKKYKSTPIKKCQRTKRRRKIEDKDTYCFRSTYAKNIEEDRLLRVALKQKKDNRERNWIIRAGKLGKKDF